MIIYSPFFKPLFWTAIGLLYALIIAGAPLLAADLGIAMTWWKWLLAAFWYIFLSYSVAGAMTLRAEREPGAWYKFLGFHLAIAMVLGMLFGWLFFKV